MGSPATWRAKCEFAPSAASTSLHSTVRPSSSVTVQPSAVRVYCFAAAPSSTCTAPLRFTASKSRASKARRGRMAPGASPTPVSREKGTRRAFPPGATKITPQLGIRRASAFTRWASAGSMRSRVRITLPLRASPQTLSRGKVAFSMSRVRTPCLASCSAAVHPPGPPPMMQASTERASWPGVEEYRSSLIPIPSLRPGGPDDQLRNASALNCSRKRTSFSQ